MAVGSLRAMSVRSWVFLAVALAAVPLAAVVVVGDLRAYRTDIEASERSCRQAVETLSLRLADLAAESSRLMSALATFPEIQGHDGAASSALFARVLGNSPGFNTLLAADPQGRVFASSRPGADLPPTIADRKYYRDLVASGDFSIGEYAVSRSAAAPVLHYAMPARDGAGQLTAIVVAGFNLRELSNVLVGVGLPPGSEVVATDHAGTVLYRTGHPEAVGRPDDPAAFARMKGPGASETTYETAVDGSRYLMAHKPLAWRGGAPYLYLRAEVPEAMVTGRARAVWRRDLLVLLFTFLLAAACAWFVGERLVARRLQRVSRAADRLAAGDLSARSELGHDQSEVGRLARAFDAMSAAIQDHTGRLQAAEAERRASEEFLATTLLSIGDAVLVADEQGRVVRMNPVAEELSGYRLSEAQGKPVTEVLKLVRGGSDEPAEDPVGRVLREQVVVALANHTELVSRDGRRRHIADSAAPIRGPGQGALRGVVMVFRDVTERHQLQEQVLQAQKMETVGRLAGGIAHDFNNLLVAILGGADLIEKTEGLDEDTRSIAQGVREAATRGADLTRSLLAYARKSPAAARPLDAHEAIEAAVKVLSRTIDRSVAIESDLKAETAVVKGDAVALQQVVLNLGLNARDAMPAGGLFRIATRDVLLSASDCAALDANQLRPGEHLEVVFKDTGTGMSREVLSHLFEPFFTTKTKGQGTGLGLASVYGTVRSHGGWIGVDSAPGRGTEFRVLLPICGERVRQAPKPAPVVERGSGRVLLADDEPSVRMFAQTVLESLGYEVASATDGEQAVRLFREAEGKFAAVVLDMVMPKLNGIATFEALRALAPEVRAVISSGYHDDPKVQELAASGRVVFLAKPYTAAAIGEAITAIRKAVPAAGAGPG